MTELPSDSEFVTVQELAARLKVSAQTVRVMIADGRLPEPITISPRIRRWPIGVLDILTGNKSGNPQNIIC